MTDQAAVSDSLQLLEYVCTFYNINMIFYSMILCGFHRKTIAKIDQSEFEGFEYVNPLLMSQEDCV
jgi:hypothetical protein